MNHQEVQYHFSQDLHIFFSYRQVQYKLGLQLFEKISLADGSGSGKTIVYTIGNTIVNNGNTRLNKRNNETEEKDEERWRLYSVPWREDHLCDPVCEGDGFVSNWFPFTACLTVLNPPCR